MSATGRERGAPPRVLVLTASMGSGHLEVAAELSARLRAAGAETEVLDILEAAGPAGRRVRRTYRLLLRWLPWFYDAVMRTWARYPKPWERLTAGGAEPFEAVVRESARAFDPDVVVSTYNLAGQCAGRLRARGELSVPALMFVIDPGAHPYWTHPGLDGYLVPTAVTGDALPTGSAPVQVVGPMLRPEFDVDSDRASARTRARAELGLGRLDTVVLVSAGSWAAGHLVSTTTHLAAQAGLRVMVLCGRDPAVVRQVEAAGAQAIGWTDRMASYLRAADVLVDNAGGLTCWEALACGTPVVIHDPLPGHGRLNARALDSAGWARWVRRPADLGAAVRRPRPGAPLPDPDADAVDVVLTAAGRSRPDTRTGSHADTRADAGARTYADTGADTPAATGVRP